MAVSSSSGSAAAAAEAARQRAAEAARQRAAAAAKAKAAAKTERPTKGRSAFTDARPVPKAGPAAAPIRERPTKNRSAFVTKGTRVPRDIEAINEAADKGPEAGARALEQRLRKTDDAQEREKVLSQSYAAIDKITAGLRGPNVTQAQTDDTVKSLEASARLVGKDGQRAIASRLQQGGSPFAPPSFADQTAAETRLNVALKNTHASVLAGGVADAYRAKGDYQKADAVPGATAAQNAGETQARDAVAIPKLSDERAKLEGQLDATKAEAAKKATDLIALSQKDPSKLPDGVSVVSTPNGAVVTQQDQKGNVQSRTTASIDGENVSLQEETFANGRAQVSRIEATAEGVTTTSATLNRAAGKTQAPIDVEALKAANDPNVLLQQQTLAHNGDELKRTDLLVKDGGVQRSVTDYLQHDDEGGLDDKLKGKFDGDQPIDCAVTRTYTVPPPGSKEEATFARTQVFSQGGSRATSSVKKELDRDDDAPPPTANDVQQFADLETKLRDEGWDEFDGDQDNPKQWKLETTSGNTYRAQTFIEGSPDATTVTTRTASGNDVTEETKGQWFDDDGELKDVSATSSRSYGDDGRLVSLDSRSEDANGNVSEQSYRVTKTNGEFHTKGTTTEIPADGPERTSITEQVERETKKGNQLVSAKQTIHGPGGSAVATITPDRRTLEVNGRAVKSVAELNALGDARAALGAAAQTGVDGQLQSYAANRGVDPAALQGDGQAKDDAKPGDRADAVARNAEWGRAGLNLLQKPLTGVDSKAPSVGWASQQKLTGFQLSSTALKGAAGLVGFGASAANLVDGIRSGDPAEIVKAGLGTAGSAAGLVETGAGAAGLVKYGGGSPASSVAGIAGKFSLGLGVATGGAQIFTGIQQGDGYEIAKGTVAVGGAVGGFVLGGAAAGAWGGPAGVAVGALVGIGAFGVTKAIDALADKEHQIADVEI